MKRIETENGYWTHDEENGCYSFTLDTAKELDAERLIQEYKDSHPISHTGRFGYVRSQCIYTSLQAAERARHKDATMFAYDRLAGENPF